MQKLNNTSGPKDPENPANLSKNVFLGATNRCLMVLGRDKNLRTSSIVLFKIS